MGSAAELAALVGWRCERECVWVWWGFGAWERGLVFAWVCVWEWEWSSWTLTYGRLDGGAV